MMKKPPPPRVRMLLRIWSGKLEQGLLSPDEVGALARLLLMLADGDSVDDIFGIWRPANRPHDPGLEQRLHDMAAMRLPVALGGEGLSYPETIKLTAEQHKKSVDTIKSDYKSEAGMAIRAAAREIGEFRASLGIAERWQGGKTQDLSPPDKA